MKKILYTFILVIAVSTAYSQYMTDAYRLSNYQVQGTARSTAMGNAIGAVGGDFTSLSVNPAGIALYQTNEFSFTPAFKLSKVNLKLSPNTFNEDNLKVSVDQVGYIGTSKPRNSNSSLVSINYGLGFNKLADFNQLFIGSIDQSPQSYLDNIVDYANNEGLTNAYLNQGYDNVEYRDWHTKAAWDTYLINPALDNNEQEIDGQYTSLLYENEKVDQLKSGEKSGRINEYLFSVGFNFNHRVYLGATAGIHDVLYRQETNYTEYFTDNSFTLSDIYEATGTGYNIKIGAIVKPLPSVRLGLAFHSPTYYTINEESTLSMQSNLLENHFSKGVNAFDYDFHTPMKLVTSGAFVIKKIAIVSVDTEFIDYSSMRFRNGGGGDPMTDLNAEISSIYEDVINYRLGVEFRLHKNLSLLGGYEFYDNPLKDNISLNEEVQDGNIESFSFGFGYSLKNFYLDTAFKHSENKGIQYNPEPNFTNTTFDNTNNNVTFTLGFRF